MAQSFTAGIADIFKALRRALTRTGVKVGGTAGYPRVEIHSVVEDAPSTKDNAVRSITATIECISDKKVEDIITLAEGNIARIFSTAGLSATGWTIFGIIPGQVRLFEEQAAQEQTAVIYRILQDVTIWAEKTETN